jgi:RNA polymerase sigma-70 factor (ECF subfamily)
MKGQAMRQKDKKDYKDERLLTSHLRDIEEAYAYLFDTYFKTLVDYAIRLIHDEDKAMDMVQTVFVKLYDGHSSLPVQISPRYYLYKAVYHQCLNELRHQRIMAGYMEAGDGEFYQREVLQTPDEEMLLQSKEVSRFIQEAVRTLPDRCREVYLLKFAEGLHNKEVAERLGISAKTVEAQTTKALSHLRNELAWLAAI